MKLTVSERILLHLLSYPKPRDSFDVPAEVTQDGIAASINIRRSHVPRSISQLIKEGLIEEIISHIHGGERRRKAYFLTQKGYALATELKEKLMNTTVRYVKPNGIPSSAPLRQVLQELNLSFSQGVSTLMREGVVVPREKPVEPEGKKIFIGRESEMKTLTEKYTLSSSKVQVVFILGETGIGKTALLSNFITRMKMEGAPVLTMRCVYSGMFDPYMPFWEGLRKFAEEYPDFTQLFKEVKSISMKDGATLEMLFAHMLEILLRLGGRLPLIIIIEDMQNASPEFLRFIHYLSFRLGKGMIVCSYNLQKGSDLSILQEIRAGLAREGIFAEISLQPLDKTETTLLVKSYKPELSEKEIETLWNISHGNPYYILTMLEGGFPRVTVMPDSLREVALNNISRFGKKATELAEYASVIGPEFDLRVLEAVTGLSEGEFYERMEFMFEHRIFSESSSQGKCSFNPPLIQEIVYSSLSKPRAARMHEEVANAIEDIYMDELEDHIFELARHYLAAGNIEKGVQYAEMCAERCEETLSYTQAIEYLKAGISLMENQEKYRADTARLREHLAEVYYLAGQYENALIELNNLLRLMERSADLRRKIAGVHLRQGKIDEAIEEYTAISKEPGIDQESLARVYADLANAYLKKDDAVHALEFAEKAYSLAKRTDDVIERAHILMLLAISNWKMGVHRAGVELMQECVRLREGFSDPMELSHSYNILGMILADAKMFDDAEGFLKKALELKERMPDPYGRISIKNNLALVSSMRGDYTTALKGFEETLKEAETLKDNALIFGAASNLGGIYLRMNRPEDALRYFERAEKVSEHLNDPSARPNSAYNLACAYISLKRFDDALNWIRIAESRATTGEQKARFALTLCELFIESERPLPHEEMEHAFELCHTSRDHILLSWAHRIASKRFRKAGDIERALTHAEESIAISREVHSMLNLGLAYLEAARTLKIMGKEEDARRNASLALGAFIQEKADRLISELRSEFPDIEPVTPQG